MILRLTGHSDIIKIKLDSKYDIGDLDKFLIPGNFWLGRY